MQKIVINRCYGGFGLSLVGYARYAELKGKKAYFFCNTDPETGKLDLDKYYPVSIITGNVFTSIFTIPNPNEYLQKKNWHDMTDKEREEFDKRYRKVSLYAGNFKRDDPDLVRVVEELGEKASGDLSRLAVIEVPDGVNWEISEYDGYESIEEVHRSWG